MLDSAAESLPAIAAAIAVLAIVWALAALAQRVVRIAVVYVHSPTLRNLLHQLAYFAVWGVGVLVALDVAGVDVKTIATGLGLGGVALGFALKDILSNMVSGLLILMSHTFEIDDQIVVGDTEGTVERIEVRATHIRTYDGRLVLVPNGEVFTARVTNNTASPKRRASVFLFLGYDQDLDRALAVIRDAVPRVAGVAAEPVALARLIDLTPGHLHLEVQFWTDSRRADFMSTASEVRLAILRALAKSGIGLPRPGHRNVTITDVRGGDTGTAATSV